MGAKLAGMVAAMQRRMPELFGVLQKGQRLLIDDGKLRLRVIRADQNEILCSAEVGGVISDRKGVNVPDAVVPVPALTDKDKSDLQFALEQGADWIALSFVQGGVATPLSEATLGGGELSGLMTFLTKDLTAVQNQLGRLALASATTVNNQHALGIDLQGNPGQDFFIPPAAALGKTNPANAGTAQVSASVNDPAALMASDYEMRFSAGSVSVVRLSDGDSTSFAVPPTAFNKDGLTFNIDSGAAAAGDRILIRPFEAAARRLNISPTAVSKGVRALESRHNVTLFTRTTRGFALTPQGQALLAWTVLS